MCRYNRFEVVLETGWRTSSGQTMCARTFAAARLVAPRSCDRA
jgi:hypothetical protein